MSTHYHIMLNASSTAENKEKTAPHVYLQMQLKRRSSSLNCSRWLFRPRRPPWRTRARLCQGGGSPNFAGGLATSLAGGLAGTSAQTSATCCNMLQPPLRKVRQVRKVLEP